MTEITIIEIAGELVVDSRLIAEQLNANDDLLLGILEKPFLNAFDLLAIIRCLSLLRGKDPVKTSIPELFKLAEKISKNTSAFNLLKMAVVEGIACDAQALVSERVAVQGWFEENFQLYFPGAKLIKPYSIKGKRPDCILSIEGVHYPVECKLNFSKRGLLQLKGYMKLWAVERGIAVAHKFFVKIPQSISAIETQT